MSVTVDEQMLISMLGDMWNVFMEVTMDKNMTGGITAKNEWHPDDVKDFRYHLHAMQNIVASRSTYRELNNTKEGK